MDKIKQAEAEINQIVRKNLQTLIETHEITIAAFCDYIKNKNEPYVNRTTLKRFIDGKITNINIAFLVSCSHAFGVSLDNLVSQNFNPHENYTKLEEKFKNIPKIESKTKSFSFDYSANEIFIENPESPLLKKYIQLYYCYYYSTVATENNTDKIQDALIFGTLKIEPNGKKCKATLTIDTKKHDKNGNPLYKVYIGNVVVCPSIQSVYCMLTLENGDFCFIIFRYSHLNINKQECRLAEVLSTSSIPDKRYPIIHRMFLCNEKIKEDDLITIAPHLCLNSSDILISEEKLLALAEQSEDYKLIVQEIFKKDPELMYCIKEKTIQEFFENFENDLEIEELPIFITKLRYYSFTKRYNKVSTSADESIRNALLQKGYFQNDIS